MVSPMPPIPVSPHRSPRPQRPTSWRDLLSRERTRYNTLGLGATPWPVLTRLPMAGFEVSTEAYSAIRKWYQKNIGLPEQRGGNSARGLAALIRALPPSKQLSRLELRAALTEVISGHLEWGDHHSDGRFKMGAYAHAALDAAGLPHNLTEREQDELQTSRLRRFFLFNRDRVEAGGAGPGSPLLATECPASDCPFRTARLPGPRADAPVLLDFMSVGGGRPKSPKASILRPRPTSTQGHQGPRSDLDRSLHLLRRGRGWDRRQVRQPRGLSANAETRPEF